MTTKQLGILQHALGLDQYGRGEFTRNHFCAGEDDEGDCRMLVADGYMETFEREWLPYYNCRVTERGKQAVRDFSPSAPVLTRAQKRYRAFLDADCGLKFGEWLKAVRL